MSRGERADLFLVARGFAKSRAEAQAAIRAGQVQADGIVITKPAQELHTEMKITYQPEHPFVSRGALKLAAALDHFALSPEARICLDLGASTGGFTEVLLSRGAARVYAVDVGHEQLHPKIAGDPRVLRREGLNARDLTRVQVPEPVGALVADVSFISLKLVLPAAFSLAAPEAWGVFLIKPQFEVGRGGIGRGGIVKETALREAAAADIAAFVTGQGWSVLGMMESPIRGGDGNIEYLLAATRK
jgi:23S rRNA (cytidine1920-2'-O)/16S rRNA (cytidine1409-2'-O)-methyltransferase